MPQPRLPLVAATLLAAVLGAGAAGCDDASATIDPGSGPGGTVLPVPDAGGDLATAPIECIGNLCRHACGEMAETTISGRVYDPAGLNPLYNVVVYIPSTTPAALPTGASCDSCSSLFTGDPIAVALTDADGKFVMHKPADGNDIPLVVQVGKWRMQYKLPLVVACSDNPQPDRSLRLPRNHLEGDIPQIAISTGGADTLECLLRRVGVDASEYGPGDTTAGHIHIFRGHNGGGFQNGAVPDTSPSAPQSASALWTSGQNLMKYDIVLLSCEGAETLAANQQALHDYASAGGRVFASHFHYAFFNTGPYASESIATWTAGSQAIDNITADIVTTFPKGMALKQWLGTVSALTNGQLPIEEARHNADVGPENKPSQAWILADARSRAPGAAEYLSFNTPTDAPLTDAGVPNYCGRVVYSDLHVGAASNDYGGSNSNSLITPRGCATRQLSPQEKALEFMLFDLSSCVTPNDATPIPPIM